MTTTYRIQFTDPDDNKGTSLVVQAPDFTSDSTGTWLPEKLSHYAAEQSKLLMNAGHCCSFMSNENGTTYRRQTVSVFAVTVGSVGRKAPDAPSYERLLVRYEHLRIKYEGSDALFEPRRLV